MWKLKFKLIFILIKVSQMHGGVRFKIEGRRLCHRQPSKVYPRVNQLNDKYNFLKMSSWKIVDAEKHFSKCRVFN